MQRPPLRPVCPPLRPVPPAFALTLALLGTALLGGGLLPACGTSTPAPADGPNGSPTRLSANSPLGPAVFPFRAASAEYTLTRGERVRIHVRETGDPEEVILEFEPPPGATRVAESGTRIEVTRTASAILFSNGPSSHIELVRFGAIPGDEWEAGTEKIRFDGWQRISVPAGTYDAARIRWLKRRGDVEFVETWWLAPDVGLIRMESDRGGVFVETLERATR